MKDLRIRKLLSLFLCLAMCLSMVPAAWANEPDYEDTDYEDTGYEETSYEDTDFEDADYENYGDLENEEEAGAEPVWVCILTEPEEAQITVYDPEQIDEFGEPVVFLAEEDSAYWLLPGEYLADFECAGYEPLLGAAFTVADEPLQFEVSLTPVDERVAVAFAFEEAELAVTVYDPAEPDENDEPSVVAPEEDGTYLLLPGEYLYDAAADGYEPLEEEPFEVVADEPLEICVSLTAITNDAEQTDEPEQVSEPEQGDEPEQISEPEQGDEPEQISEPEQTDEPEQISEPEQGDEPEQVSEPEEREGAGRESEQE